MVPVVQLVLVSVATVQPVLVHVTFAVPTHCVAVIVLISHTVPDAATEPVQLLV